MTSTLFMGGIANVVDPLFFWPIYIWSWIALLIIAGIAYAIMYYRGWKPLRALHGLYYALKNGSSVAFIFNGELVGDLVAERDAKCIFDYSKDENAFDVPEIPIIQPIITKLYRWAFYYPTLYLPNISPLDALVYKIGKVNLDVKIAAKLEGGKWSRSAAVVCTGVPVEIIVDSGRWTIRDSPEHKLVEDSARQHNELDPKDRIETYSKFQEYLLEGKIPCPLGLEPVVNTYWQRIDAAFPLDLDKNEWAGKIRQMAKDKDIAEALDLNRWTIYIFVAGAAFAAVILLMRFVLAMGAHH